MKQLASLLFFLVTLLLGPAGCGGSDGGGLNESDAGAPLPTLSGAAAAVPRGLKYGEVVVLKSSYWRSYLSAQDGDVVHHVVHPLEWEEWEVVNPADLTSKEFVRFNDDVALKSTFRERYLTSWDDTWVRHQPWVKEWEHWSFRDPANPTSKEIVAAGMGVALHSTAHDWYLTAREGEGVGQAAWVKPWELWNILPKDYVRAPSQELNYGDVLTLKSPAARSYLSAQDGDRVEVVQRTLDWEQWEIVNADAPDATGPVTYGDRVALYAIDKGKFLSAQDSGNTKQARQMLDWEAWTIVDASTPGGTGKVPLLKPVAFHSPHFKTYLSAQQGTARHVAKLDASEKWSVLPPRYLSNWMSAESDIHGKKLKEITFPASHDTATWQFRDVFSHDPAAATFATMTTVVDHLVNALTTINLGIVSFDVTGGMANQLKDSGLHEVYASIAALAKATDQDVAQQLAGGIRWLDLRLDLREEGPYSHHLLVGVKMETVIDQVAAFVKTTHGEIVVLEISHVVPESSSRYRAFAEMLKQKLGDSMYYPDQAAPLPPVTNPLDSTYSDVIGEVRKSRVIVLTEGAWLNPQGDGFWDIGTLGLTGAYANKSFRELAIANQKENFSKRQKGGAFRLYLTLTGDPVTELAPRALYLMYDGYKNFAFNLIKPYIEALVPDWFGARSAALDKLRSFIDSALRGVLNALGLAPLYSIGAAADWFSLEELSQKINHDLGDVMLQFQDDNKTGYNDVTVVYADYAHKTDLVERAIAWSKKDPRP